ncbi:MAG: ATP-binding protein [Mariniphaga sp.]
MIKQSDLISTIEMQWERLISSETGMKRDLLSKLPENLQSHALIISGIRRCGKSTLLSQLIQPENGNDFFINFDTPKLYNFEMSDFEILDLVISEKNSKRLFFDEIQVIEGWELYVRQKLDEGYNVTITGSNSSMLSQELGTKLTGRHIAKELFPFSFSEFARFKKTDPDFNAFMDYFPTGGFPEFVKNKNPDILTSLFDDILFRDIAVRYGIRDVNSLKKLLLYLIANVGNLFTANKITHALGIKSTVTVLDYISFFERSYLINLVPRFSWSYRAQLVNPRKIYAIDNGLIKSVSPGWTKDLEKKLENVVYWALRQTGKDIYYFNESGSECDFVVAWNNKTEQLIQVCYEMNTENSAREIKGLTDAMNYFKLDSGLIITLNQHDKIKVQNKNISVIPAYSWLTGSLH